MADNTYTRHATGITHSDESGVWVDLHGFPNLVLKNGVTDSVTWSQ
jgi:hypothetical protein